MEIYLIYLGVCYPPLQINNHTLPARIPTASFSLYPFLLALLFLLLRLFPPSSRHNQQNPPLFAVQHDHRTPLRAPAAARVHTTR